MRPRRVALGIGDAFRLCSIRVWAILQFDTEVIDSVVHRNYAEIQFTKGFTRDFIVWTGVCGCQGGVWGMETNPIGFRHRILCYGLVWTPRCLLPVKDYLQARLSYGRRCTAVYCEGLLDENPIEKRVPGLGDTQRVHWAVWKFGILRACDLVQRGLS